MYNNLDVKLSPFLGLTTDEILANALVFFVAGYDTTATSLSFFMYNMALNPESQDKLVEEINNVVGEKVKDSKAPTKITIIYISISFKAQLTVLYFFYQTDVIMKIPI